MRLPFFQRRKKWSTETLEAPPDEHAISRRRGPASAKRKAASEQPFQAISPEILRQVKLLELRTRGPVNSTFTGEYRSVFKGQGMEFSEVREYQPGDEVRSIDWNVTARMQRPYVKRYIEERELTVMIAVDVSGSERFGTRRRFKSEVASELAAVLAMCATRNNDRVGTLLFTDQIEHEVPPRKGRRQALRVIRDLLAFEPRGRGTNIAAATEYLNKMLSHKAIIFLVSWIFSARTSSGRSSCSRNVTTSWLLPSRIPASATSRISGWPGSSIPETNFMLDVDTSDRRVRDSYDIMVSEDASPPPARAPAAGNRRDPRPNQRRHHGAAAAVLPDQRNAGHPPMKRPAAALGLVALWPAGPARAGHRVLRAGVALSADTACESATRSC